MVILSIGITFDRNNLKRLTHLRTCIKSKSSLITSFVFDTVCDYYLHEMCMEFAVPNCLESACYDPAKSLTEASKCITHHFQEGNLPQNSKCTRCRRACWSAECLTGMRCQLCGLTVSILVYLTHLKLKEEEIRNGQRYRASLISRTDHANGTSHPFPRVIVDSHFGARSSTSSPLFL